GPSDLGGSERSGRPIPPRERRASPGSPAPHPPGGRCPLMAPTSRHRSPPAPPYRSSLGERSSGTRLRPRIVGSRKPVPGGVVVSKPVDIAPATGKLGVLTPGMGAVATTLFAGVLAARKGLAAPYGSLTQLGHIRLGRRDDARNPLIKDFVPLASLDDLVFGGWDVYSDDAYAAAMKAGVLEPRHIESIGDELRLIEPMAAVFDHQWVRNLNDVDNVKEVEGSKMDQAEALMADIDRFRSEHGVERVVMVWCGSTESYRDPSEVHMDLASFEKGLKESHPDIAPSQIYAYAA